MSDTANFLLQWLSANPHWAGFITFLISAGESVAILGTIVPGSIMMTAVGTLAGAGIIPLWPSLIWAMLGAIAGDGISYWIGYYFKDNLHRIWPFRNHPEMLENGEKFFKNHGGKSVFIGRFVGPVRALVPVVAGMLRLKPLIFTIANVLSAIIWAPVYMLPGILLGAASLELPPDVTSHAVIIVLLTIMFIILCIWLTIKLLANIHDQIDQGLTWIWESLKKSRYFRLITSILKHHNSLKTHGQIVLAFYFLFTLALFFALAIFLHFTPPDSILINNVLFHLFRSLQTPTTNIVMISLTILGEAQVILPMAGLVFLWLYFTKRRHTAWHVLGLILLAGASTGLLKHFIHEARPWGILHPISYSGFPSGHSVLSLAFYIGLGVLLAKIWKLNKWSRRFLLLLLGTFVFIISMTRVYLGLHWMTDVIAGWLLGASLLILVSLSYNRHRETEFMTGRSLLLVSLVSLLFCYSVFAYRNFDTMRTDYQQIDWPIYNITEEAWWNRTGEDLPLYRVNRFGLEQEILNLQWLGSLENIKELLIKNDWSIPPDHDWISVLQRLTDVNSAEHLPVVSPLYYGKKPVLVLTKPIGKDKKLMVLRLWQSDLKVTNSADSLWVGSVDTIPRTFSWLLKNTRPRKISLTPELIFTKIPPELTIKPITVKTQQDKERPILLIKRK